jgi:2,3-bisphosphoglycerate-independent phosphoglycerate mutase
MNPNPSHAPFDAVRLAQARGLTPVADRLMREFPWTLIKTSGEDVGLPGGGEDGTPPTMGNSEVGHQNIGAGRVVYQESVAITRECRRGLEKNATIAAALKRAIGTNHAVHLMGICSDAGVHGLLEHLEAILKAAKSLGVPSTRVFLHLFTDGRDTGPFSGLEFSKRVEAMCRNVGVGTIGTVSGRYYSMDRDYRWERVQRAYDVMTGRGSAKRFASAAAAIQDYYDHPLNDSQKGDEFIPPSVIAGPSGETPVIKDGDSVIFYNYRGDRPRELSAAFVFPDDKWAAIKPSPDSGKHGFDRGRKLDVHFVAMTEYWDELLPFVKVAFPKPPKMVNIAGEYISKLGLTQFRCAETEKYPHVTFFFNDSRDQPFPGETRENPQSPKVATYDLKPEMSADLVRDAVLRRLAAPAQGPERCEDCLVVNFANGDMVGHTGNLEASVKAVATVDACVGAIVDAALKRAGKALVLADHGNCEQMLDPATGSPHTAHTVYDVPIIAVDPALKGRKLRGDQNVAGWFDPAVRAKRGRLGDVVPTALAMMGLPKPPEMDGVSLVVEAN